jgi:hypothetical protein
LEHRDDTSLARRGFFAMMAYNTLLRAPTSATSYRVSSGIELRLQVNNVTDEPLRIHRDNQANRTVDTMNTEDDLFDVTLKF